MITIIKFKLLSLLLFPIALLINYFASSFPDLIDKYYSSYINKYTVMLLSKISGIFPFSLYELSMYIIVLSIILSVIHLIISIYKNKNSTVSLIKKYMLNILSFLSIAYFLFIILWGLNYNRIPLQTTLISSYNETYNKNMSISNHSIEELGNLYNHLISQANDVRKKVDEDNNGVMKCKTDYKGIISRAQLGVNNISNFFPQLAGNYSNPKYVISSNLMCYTGITGIYFPFTGEANINIATPDLYIPSTTLHEMAHQRGFASEDEANFIGYLASINHPDIDFKYSGYILALNHTANALSRVDYDSYKILTKKISNEVMTDLKNNQIFWNKYEGKIDEVSNKFNDSYLKANGVKDGTGSYGKMVDLLLTYYNLYPYLD
ncbi:MAG: DUF3810 domain-containing protein [Peptostreptococcaceae bacterium]